MVATVRYYDRALLGCIAALLFVGLVFLYSISADGARYFFKQTMYSGIGMLCFFLVRQITVLQWRQFAGRILIFVTLLLLCTALFGIEKNGAQRWLGFVFVSLQPAEFFKLAVLLCTAHWLALTFKGKRFGKYHYKNFVCLIPAFLLLIAQPDFGTFALLSILILGIFFLSGCYTGRQIFIGIGLAALLVGSLAVLAITEDYRMARINAFIDPYADPYNTGYHQRLSLIAFWRGGWWGDGLGRSIGKLAGQLPEAYSDFIVAIIAEEVGYISFIALCGLFTFFIARIIRVGAAANERGDAFAALYAFGVALLIAGQVLINIGGNLSLFPVKGMTLPLISYGGSSLLSMAIMLSIVLRIDRENRTSQRSGGGL